MINYFIIALVLTVVIVSLILFLRRNARDKKSLGERLNSQDIKADRHDKDDQDT